MISIPYEVPASEVIQRVWLVDGPKADFNRYTGYKHYTIPFTRPINLKKMYEQVYELHNCSVTYSLEVEYFPQIYTKRITVVGEYEGVRVIVERMYVPITG